MEAKNRTHRYYVEEHKVDLLGIDELGISMIECALSDLLIRFHEALKEATPIDVKTNYDKVNELLTIIKGRQEE
jgi:hypothetical protein